MARLWIWIVPLECTILSLSLLELRGSQRYAVLLGIVLLLVTSLVLQASEVLDPLRERFSAGGAFCARLVSM